jgi:hypothetical protein
VSLRNARPLSRLENISKEKSYVHVKTTTSFGLINHRQTKPHLIVFSTVISMSDVCPKHINPFKYKDFKGAIQIDPDYLGYFSIYSIDFKGTWSDNNFTP